MSDARIRELERRWRETGSVEDEAAWQRARVRAGELPEERLRLAARCGHTGALRAVPDAGPRFDRDPGAWQAWMEPRHPEALVWLAVAAAADALPSLPAGEERARLEDAVQAGRDWLACPCTLHGDACRALPLAIGVHPLRLALAGVFLRPGTPADPLFDEPTLRERVAETVGAAAVVLRRRPGELLAGLVARLAEELLGDADRPPAPPCPLDALLRLPDLELCEQVAARLPPPGEADEAAPGSVAHVVLAVWEALTTIGGGGLEWLLEGAGPEGAARILAALREVGAEEAERALRAALAGLPDSPSGLEALERPFREVREALLGALARWLRARPAALRIALRRDEDLRAWGLALRLP